MTSHRDGEGTERMGDDDERGMEVGGRRKGGRTNVFSTFKSQFQIEGRERETEGEERRWRNESITSFRCQQS